jgi:hypothetical protein
MDRILKVFLKFLCKLRFTRGFIHYFLRRWALLLAFLSRRFGVWQSQSDGKRGTVTFLKTERADTRTQFDSRKWVAAASVPASASVPRRHQVSNEPQLVSSPSVTPSYPPATAHLTAKPRGNRAYPTSSETHEVGQPSQFLQVADGYLGHGLFGLPSSERSSRSPSPRDHSPLLPSSHGNVPSSSPSNPGHHSWQSSIPVVMNVEGPSTESFHLSPLTSPYAIGSSTTHSSPVSNTPHLCEVLPQLSTGTSYTLSNVNLPSDCSVKPMNPDQVPRYTRNTTVQVDSVITTIKCLLFRSDLAKGQTTLFSP